MLCQLLRRRFFSSSTASTAPRGRITAREGCILIDNGAKRNAMTLDMYRDVPGAVAAHLRGVQLSTRRVCLLAGAGTAGADLMLAFKRDPRMFEHVLLMDATPLAPSTVARLSVPRPL